MSQAPILLFLKKPIDLIPDRGIVGLRFLSSSLLRRASSLAFYLFISCGFFAAGRILRSASLSSSLKLSLFSMILVEGTGKFPDHAGFDLKTLFATDLTKYIHG
jgi:hypothetical protein